MNDDTPIFIELVKEYNRAGKKIPWLYTDKPKGTIGIVSDTSTGIHPPFETKYIRQYWQEPGYLFD